MSPAHKLMKHSIKRMLKISILLPFFSAFFHLYPLHFNHSAGFLTNFINYPVFLCHSPPLHFSVPSALSLISFLSYYSHNFLYISSALSSCCLFLLSPFYHSPSFLFSYQPLPFIYPSNPLLSYRSFFLYPLLIFSTPSVQIPMQQWQEARLGRWNVHLTPMVMGYQI